jgi:hypothetical protein
LAAIASAVNNHEDCGQEDCLACIERRPLWRRQHDLKASRPDSWDEPVCSLIGHRSRRAGIIHLPTRLH